MTINEKKKAIVLTKAEMKDAKIVGSEMYNMLQMARRDYPGFKTVEEKSKRNKVDFAGLNMKTIKAYVEKNGSDEQKETLVFISKKTVDEDGNYHEAQSFFQIKSWFLNEFPEIKKQRKAYREKVQKIYEEAEAKAAAAIAAA